MELLRLSGSSILMSVLFAASAAAAVEANQKGFATEYRSAYSQKAIGIDTGWGFDTLTYAVAEGRKELPFREPYNEQGHSLLLSRLMRDFSEGGQIHLVISDKSRIRAVKAMLTSSYTERGVMSELGIGVGASGWQDTAILGRIKIAVMTFPRFSVGYSYEAALSRDERPEWLTAHRLSIQWFFSEALQPTEKWKKDSSVNDEAI